MTCKLVVGMGSRSRVGSTNGTGSTNGIGSTTGTGSKFEPVQDKIELESELESNYFKQDGNPYNGPSAIMVKVKPVGQNGENGLVGQNYYPSDIN